MFLFDIRCILISKNNFKYKNSELFLSHALYYQLKYLRLRFAFY